MAYKKILFRRDPAASWTSENPVLSAGEVGLETDTGKIKIGNGSSVWTALSYFVGNLPGATLDAIGDVTITSVQNGDFLRYNGSASAWINDPVNLSTDTVGSYVEYLIPGTGVTISNNFGEGSTPTISIGQEVGTSASVTFTQVDTIGNLVVGGNLTVNGTTTTLNTETLSIEDNFVVLNSNVTGAPVTNAGIVVERGDSANVAIRWNEALDVWEITTDGSAHSSIATIADVVGATDAITVESLSNTMIITPTHGQFLSYNSSSAVWVNDAIDLGTDTTGSYVQSLVAGTGVTLTNNSGESATPTVAIGQAVETSSSVTFAQVNAPLTGNVTGNVTGSSGSTTGNAATATALQNTRTISLSGDVSGSVSFDGSVNVDISATIQPNSVALGTDTTGDYVSSLVAGTGIALTNNSGESATPTVALNATIDNLSDVTIDSGPQIGDTGPAGGKIFITPSTAGNTTGKYFEAGPYLNPDAARSWAGNGAGDYTNETLAVSGADGTAIGTGAQNTIDIVAQSGNTAAGCAAAYASEYTFGGFSDWFLPSKDELNQLYINRASISGFDADFYQSSSEGGADSSFYQDFSSGGQGAAGKGELWRVRPVRSFTASGGVQSGDFLKWNGDAWVNDPVNLGEDTTGIYVADLVAGTGITITNGGSESASPTVAIGQAVATSSSVTFARVETTGDVIVGGDLSVHGTLTTINETNLAIEDTFIYLNDGSTITNPDLGWVGNYNDGTYRHAGLFRDATDGKFKFFDSYEIEPVDPINTAHATYSAAPVVAELFESTITTGTAPLSVSSSTAVTNLNADLLDGQHGSYYAPLASPTFTGTVTLPTGTVTSNMILDGTIVNADINASAAIAHSKLANATDGQVLLGTTTTGVVTATTISGDVTITGAGVTAISSGAIINADINASAAIELSKLATSTAGNIIVYNSSGVPTSVTETGDVTISDTGVTAIASGVIVNADINASAAIDKTKISGTAITAADSGTVTSTMIADGTIVNADISATAAIDLGKLADVSTNAQAASYTLVLADKNKVVEMGVGSANNLTVPANSSVAFPVGAQINILQTGAGQTTIVAAGGVTINATPGLKMRAQWSYATLIKRATDTWVLVGDISA